MRTLTPVFDDNLTGRIRYREKKRWFRRSVLVLQVEEQQTRYSNEGHSSNEILFWRDATIEDLLTGDTRMA